MVKSVKKRRLFALLMLIAGVVVLALSSLLGSSASGQDTDAGEDGAAVHTGRNIVRIINISGVIDPLIADFVIRSIEDAERERARAVILTLDTPGGLDTPMRDIIKKMTGSALPIAAYVSPSGARAASAGTFIMMAADVAAMTPGTNLGAAHPVATGVDPDSTEGIKITNDSAAYIRSLAEANGRNANWAELAVRQSVSLSADDALDQQVIDLKADTIDGLLGQLDGFRAKAKDITISTRGASLITSEMSAKERLLHLILNPNVAYFLFVYGLLALGYEAVHPGIGFGFVSGTISLLLSFYAMRILPVNLAGLALVVVGVLLLGADLYFTSHGALSVGGIISIVIGSLFIFDAPFLKVSLPLNLAMAALTAGFFLIAARKVMDARRLPVKTGQSGMIGAIGYARSNLDPLGQVFVHGEIWSGEAPEGEIIEKGEEIEVTAVSGLMLKVRKT